MVDIKPLAVFQAKDRSSYVKKLVESKRNLLREQKKVVRLGGLLNVDECTVLMTLASVANDLSDTLALAECCRKLVEHNHKSAWRMCLNLADKDEYPDIELKKNLVTFCMLHADRLEEVMRVRGKIER